MELVQQAFAIGIILIAIAGIPLANVQGQIITLQPQIEILAPNTLSLNISFSNNTNATLLEESITQEQGNLIVQSINAILLQDDEALEDLELAELAEEEPEIEEEEEEVEESDGDGGGNGNGNDDNNNNGEEPEPEEPEPILPIIPGPPEDEEAEGELELETDCGQIFIPEYVPEECRDKYLEAIEKARTPPDL